MHLINSLALASALAVSSTNSFAGCFSQCCTEHRVKSADAIVEAKVLSLSSFTCEKTNIIHTVAKLQVLRNFSKTKPVPTEISLTYPGGALHSRKCFDSRSLNLKDNEQYFIYLTQKPDKSWSAYQAFAEKSKPRFARSQRNFYRKLAAGKTTTPLLIDQDLSKAVDSGISGSKLTTHGFNEIGDKPVRLTLADSNQLIQVEVDSEFLPSGITQSQALTAVQNALDAWENSSSLKFKITQNYNFTKAASAMDGGSQIIHLQLHDTYNPIESDLTLGVGGGSMSSVTAGIINGLAFNTAQSRYVVMNHGSPTNQDQLAFEEVLTHEIGHALGLSHSSETPNEDDVDLKESTMYYQIHNDERGASLGAYDINQMERGYPTNTPPVGSNHLIRAITRSSGQPTPLANKVQLDGFDANGDTLTYNLVSQSSSNGTFNFDSDSGIVSYTSSGRFSATDLTSQNTSTGSSFYDSLEYSISDGVNTSPTYRLAIVAFVADSTPATELAEEWLTANFGSSYTNDSSNSIYTAEADPDGDGSSNIAEYVRGTNPNDSTDGAVHITYSRDNNSVTVPDIIHGDSVTIESSADLSSWNTVTKLFQTDPITENPPVIYLPDTPTEQQLFYRSRITR